MLNLETVKVNIDHWIETFLEVPNPALGGWAPCPYARRARLDQAYEVRLGDNILFDLMEIGRTGLHGRAVIILAYDPNTYSGLDFELAAKIACEQYLLPHDLIALVDHPDLPEPVNGILMNHGTYALILVQQLGDLNQKSAAVGRQGFYNTWPEAYLTELFQHRQDPRP
jgi:hypothetical protein